ncbi:ATP-dependent DNA helicase RRM3-like protein [Tanacetum coccineum]
MIVGIFRHVNQRRGFMALTYITGFPPVERLPFHLPNEQSVIFDETKSLDYMLDKASVNETNLFVMLIITDSMSCHEVVYEKTWHVMAADVLNIKRIKRNDQEMELLDEQRKNIRLTYIEHMLLSNNKSLKNIPNMSYPIAEYTRNEYYKLVHDELTYDKDVLREEHNRLYGKTYMYKIMSATCLLQGEIVLNVMSNGIAAVLLEGGRTTYLRFAIPINVVEDSICSIVADSKLVELLKMTKLIKWDEAPMMLPVVANGNMQDVVHAAINSSYLWEQFTIIKLTVNMRLGSSTNSSERAILASTYELVDMINDRMLFLLPRDEKTYNSSDTVGVADVDTILMNPFIQKRSLITSKCLAFRTIV